MVGQYLARTDFIEQLETLAARCGARFVEVVLELDAASLAERLAARALAPSRPEHLINDQLVCPEDAPRLVNSLEGLRTSRPSTVWVDARGPADEVLARLRAAVA